MAESEKPKPKTTAELQQLFFTKIVRQDGQPIMAADGSVPKAMLADLLKENPQLATLSLPNGLTAMDYLLYERSNTPRSDWKVKMFAEVAGADSVQAKAYQDAQKLTAWPGGSEGKNLETAGAENQPDVVRALVAHRKRDIALNPAPKFSDISSYVNQINWKKPGFTPLMAAAMNGSDQAVSELIASGATVNFSAGQSGDASMFAAAAGRLSTVKLLEEKGAGTDPAKELKSTSRLKLAALGGHKDVLAHYIDALKKEYKDQPKFLQETLDEALPYASSYETAKLLLEAGAKIETPNQSAMHILGKHKKNDMIYDFGTKKADMPGVLRAYIEHKGDPNKADAFDISPIQNIMRYRDIDEDLLVALVEKTDDISKVKAGNLSTPLHWVSERYDDPQNFVKAVLKKDPKVAKAIDTDGATPLYVAINSNKFASAQALIPYSDLDVRRTDIQQSLPEIAVEKMLKNRFHSIDRMKESLKILELVKTDNNVNPVRARDENHPYSKLDEAISNMEKRIKNAPLKREDQEIYDTLIKARQILNTPDSERKRNHDHSFLGLDSKALADVRKAGEAVKESAQNLSTEKPPEVDVAAFMGKKGGSRDFS